MIRSDYKVLEQQDYVLGYCPWIHQEAFVLWASLRALSRTHSLMLGNISEKEGQVVGVPS